MDWEFSNLIEDFKTLLEVIDKTGKQTEGEFSGKVRDPEINSIACKWLEIVRQKIKEYDSKN